MPNASLGVLLYALLATGVALGWPWMLLFAMTWPAVAMSAVLGYSLISNRRQCRICWAGHVANATLFVALGIRRWGNSDSCQHLLVCFAGPHPHCQRLACSAPLRALAAWISILIASQSC